ncbi:hypothetical protein ABZP36_022844 [Zizania latifolia]
MPLPPLPSTRREGLQAQAPVPASAAPGVEKKLLWDQSSVSSILDDLATHGINGKVQKDGGTPDAVDIIDGDDIVDLED